MRVTDLRGILTYISRFREKIFVLSVDSIILADDTSRHNLMLDISVLRSLNIKVVVVHGASQQIKELGEKLKITPTNVDGMGVTDENTLLLSIMASNQITHELLEGLSELDQRAVLTNAVIAHPFGIISGKDQAMTGRVERVDTEFLESILADGIIPVVPPLGFDGNGKTYRVNSDGVALEVAEALKANKLIFITTSNGVGGGGKLSTQYSVAEAEELTKKKKSELSQELISKLEHGLRACRNGVLRSHIIDGRQDEALLSEVFSNEGIGTMIYANEYQAIRRARKKDVAAVMKLIQDSIINQELVQRDRKEIAARIGDFYLFEIDRNIVGCVAIKVYEGAEGVAEMECLSVSGSHENQGIGRKMMQFAETKAREMNLKNLLALSTQAFNYLQQKGGFQEGNIDMLPPERRAKYEKSGRNSKILYKAF